MQEKVAKKTSMYHEETSLKEKGKIKCIYKKKRLKECMRAEGKIKIHLTSFFCECKFKNAERNAKQN